jgi:hypothetical protein
MTPHHRKDGTFRKGNTARQVGKEPAKHHLIVRVPEGIKGRWVLASRLVPGRGLSEWVIAKLNAAADADLGDSKAGAGPVQNPCKDSA